MKNLLYGVIVSALIAGAFFLGQVSKQASITEKNTVINNLNTEKQTLSTKLDISESELRQARLSKTTPQASQPVQQPTSLHCSSTNTGYTTFTNCY